MFLVSLWPCGLDEPSALGLSIGPPNPQRIYISEDGEKTTQKKDTTNNM